MNDANLPIDRIKLAHLLLGLLRLLAALNGLETVREIYGLSCQDGQAAHLRKEEVFSVALLVVVEI